MKTWKVYEVHCDIFVKYQKTFDPNRVLKS